jgi:hypothetical protein
MSEPREFETVDDQLGEAASPGAEDEATASGDEDVSASPAGQPRDAGGSRE